MSRWDAEKIELMEAAHTWKRRAEEAEAKMHDLLRRQDEMAAQVEQMRENAARLLAEGLGL